MPVGKGSIERATVAGSKKSTSVVKTERFLTYILTEIPVNQIQSVPEQWMTQKMNVISDTELQKSIQKYGLIEPVILRKLSDNQFQLLSGYRRLNAIKGMGMESISSRVIEGLNDEEAREIYSDLHANKTENSISLHDVKFQAVSKIVSDMPAYLL